MLCKNPGCDGGWIHLQHPAKPIGVIIMTIPCPHCNSDKSIPYPKSEWTLSIGDADPKCTSVTTTVWPPAK